MNKPFHTLYGRLGAALLLLITVFIIHSCHKDNKLSSLFLNDSVSTAKTWYENTYPVNVNSSNNLTALSADTTNGKYDYSQHIKPDWWHTTSYQRLGKAVIEIPIDPSKNFKAAIKNNSTGSFIYSKENSKTSFIILNDGTGYQAFVMTIMADAAYIGNDPGKLAKNTYRKRDANFTGMVIYFYA